jgi:hypothetical protein
MFSKYRILLFPFFAISLAKSSKNCYFPENYNYCKSSKTHTHFSFFRKIKVRENLEKSTVLRIFNFRDFLLFLFSYIFAQIFAKMGK